MLALINRKDTYVSKREERCDDYQNSSIASIWYNGEQYFCFKKGRGTSLDNFVKVYVSRNLSNFNFERDYTHMAIDVLTLEHYLPLNHYNVMLMDEERLENYLNGLILKHEENYEIEVKKFDELIKYIGKEIRPHYPYLDREIALLIRKEYRNIAYKEYKENE